MRAEKEEEQAMRYETRIVMSGKEVPPPTENEDSFLLAKKIIEDLTGFVLKKSQVGGSCNY